MKRSVKSVLNSQLIFGFMVSSWPHKVKPLFATSDHSTANFRTKHAFAARTFFPKTFVSFNHGHLRDQPQVRQVLKPPCMMLCLKVTFATDYQGVNSWMWSNQQVISQAKVEAELVPFSQHYFWRLFPFKPPFTKYS